MKKYYCWIPSFESWINAIFLFLLLSAFFVFIKVINPWLKLILFNSPELSLFIICLLCWSPLLFITWTHHLIHIGIAKLFPKIQAPELDKTEGWFPGIISWWEGLYGWLVLIFSLLMSGTIISLYLLYSEPIYKWQSIDNPPEWLVSWASLLIFVSVVYLYHFDNLVKKRLLSIKKSRISLE
jgi:hypothetical protein